VSRDDDREGKDENKYGIDSNVCMYGDRCIVYGIFFIFHTYIHF